MNNYLSDFIDMMDSCLDEKIGISATYRRGETSIPITVLAQSEWVGDMDGEFVYNVDRSIWSLDLRPLISAGIEQPARGDMIEITTPSNTIERYIVIYHDKNTCWIYQHGQNNRNRVLVYTQRVT